MNAIEEKCKLKGVRLTDQRKIIAQVMSDSKEKYGANCFNFWDDLSFHKLRPAEKFLDALIECVMRSAVLIPHHQKMLQLRSVAH